MKQKEAAKKKAKEQEQKQKEDEEARKQKEDKEATMQKGDTEEKTSTSQGSADDGAYPQPKCPRDLYKHLQRSVLLLLPFYPVSGSAAKNVEEPAGHSPRSIVPSSESPGDRPQGDLRAHAQDAAPQCAASQPKNDPMSARVSALTLSKQQEYDRICNKRWLNDTLIDFILHIRGLLFQLPNVCIMNTMKPLP